LLQACAELVGVTGETWGRPQSQMLPHYADGSKQSKKTKETSALQRCTVLVLCVWVLGAAVFCLHRKNAGGFLGLSLLGPHSASGIFWLDKVNAFFQSIEQQYPVSGWTDDMGIGAYTPGEYLEQIQAREREIAEEMQRDVERFGPVPGKKLPEGTYKGSCDGCAVLGGEGGATPHQRLTCNCKDSTGQIRESVFLLGSCVENEWVGNANGVLTCERIPHIEGADAVKALRDRGDEVAARKAEEEAAEKKKVFAAEHEKYMEYEETMQRAMEVKHKTKPGTIFDFFGFIPARWEI